VYRARARRRRSVRKQLLTTVLGVIIAGVFSLGAEALDQYNYYSSDLPDPGTLDISQLPQSTQILDRNGKLLLCRPRQPDPNRGVVGTDLAAGAQSNHRRRGQELLPQLRP